MTITAPPKLPDQRAADALIREARRFQRRRWWRRGGIAVAALILTTTVLVWIVGGVPSQSHQSRSNSKPLSGKQVIFPSLGPAISYPLTGPIGVAVDGKGVVYFTDANRVYRIDRGTHELQLIAGIETSGFSGDRGPGLKARLAGPSGVAVAPNGDVYFVDTMNDRIRMVSTKTGIISTVAGDGHIGNGGNGGPATLASLDLKSAGSGSVGLAEYLAIGPHQDLYIADGGNNEIRKVSHATGIITRVAGNGRLGSSGDGKKATQAELCAPVGIAVDKSADIFIATACGAIREVSGTTGLISTVFSARQDPALAGTGGDHDPVGLAIGPNGNLYATEAYGRRLLEIVPSSGRVALVAGTGVETLPSAHPTAGDGSPATKATFGLPLGVAVDHHGNVYVADFFNNAVREIDSQTGLITAIAGQIPQYTHCC
jgi:streptogramin lyase